MTKNPLYFSLSRAAQETGKSKSVISKALKDGKLNYASKNSDGYQIDPSDLFHVFPKNSKNVFSERKRTGENDIENTIKIRELEIKLESSDKEKRFYKEHCNKIEDERDSWKKQAETLLLQHHASPPHSVRESDSVIYDTYPNKTGLGSPVSGFGGLAAGILLFAGLGFVGTQYWSDISSYLGIDTASHDARDVKQLNSLAPASGHREPQKEIKANNIPEMEIQFKRNYTPIPD